MFFSVLVYPLTRLVVGFAYADDYEALLVECDRNVTSLRSLERKVFPRTPPEATAQIWLNWGLGYQKNCATC